jgi:hypothetical protein
VVGLGEQSSFFSEHFEQEAQNDFSIVVIDRAEFFNQPGLVHGANLI